MTGALSMVLLDQTVVSVALPEMQSELGLSDVGLNWVMNAYVLAIAAFVALGGRIGDAVGRARGFVAGVVIFALASLACGLVPSSPVGGAWIIAFRAVQGLGAAIMLPASSAIVLGAFPLEMRGRAMGIYAGVAQAFLVVGPVLGGALTQYASWRVAFLLNIPVGAVAIFLTLVAKPTEDIGGQRRIDLRGALVLVLGMGSLLIGIQQAPSWGWSSAVTVLCIAVGSCLLVAFAVLQVGTPAPLIQLRMFRNRAFFADAILVLVVRFAMVSVVIFGAIYFQTVLGMAPLDSGLSLLPVILANVFIARFAGALLDRYGAKTPATIGTFLGLIGMALWTGALSTLELTWQVPGMILLGLGIGLVIIPVNTDALSRTPARLRGQASGVIATVRQLGGALGIAIVGTLLVEAKQAEAARLVERYAGSDSSSREVRAVISSLGDDSPAVLAELERSAPWAVQDAQRAMAVATQDAFTAMVVAWGVALAVALFLMERGKQTEEAVISSYEP